MRGVVEPTPGRHGSPGEAPRTGVGDDAEARSVSRPARSWLAVEGVSRPPTRNGVVSTGEPDNQLRRANRRTASAVAAAGGRRELRRPVPAGGYSSLAPAANSRHGQGRMVFSVDRGGRQRSPPAEEAEESGEASLSKKRIPERTPRQPSPAGSPAPGSRYRHQAKKSPKVSHHRRVKR